MTILFNISFTKFNYTKEDLPTNQQKQKKTRNTHKKTGQKPRRLSLPAKFSQYFKRKQTVNPKISSANYNESQDFKIYEDIYSCYEYLALKRSFLEDKGKNGSCTLKNDDYEFIENLDCGIYIM